MKLEVSLTTIALLIFMSFVITRNAYLMGASVFVATPLVLISIAFYLRRVLSDVREL